MGGIKAVWPLEITVILRLGDLTGILDWCCPRAEADDTLDDDEIVEDGDPNRRGAEHEEEEEGWGDVERELDVILIDVTVVEPPVPDAVAPPTDLRASVA